MPTVLVVDDSAVDRRFVGGLLSRDGRFQVEFAEDGGQALGRMRQSPPDVIVTDLQMPNRNGLELVAAVRMHHPEVPIILMTGHGSEDLAVEALHRGAANYVPKPQLGERLMDAVEEALSMARADRTYDQLIACMEKCEFAFEFENDPGMIDPLVDLIQQMVAGMKLTDATGRYRVGAAVKESLLNAIYRGNLEISFDQMQDTRVSLVEGKGEDLLQQRSSQAPYKDRRVQVSVFLNPKEARFVIRDAGKGFDPAKVPAAGRPGSLDPQSGRGLVLMRAFMDEVTFNAAGNEVTLLKRRE
ncbi:MAG TPA: response regulator [Pirellulaceae bacterium]|nr:response regulator [Pirellulaceae bacterium]